MKLAFRALAIPFAVAFRHAAAERRETATVWVEARRGTHVGYGEGCPRPYVTGETVDSALSFLAEHGEDLGRSVTDVSSLRAWMANHAEAINRHPASWCGAELAILDLLAREANTTVDVLLGLGPLSSLFRYTAVMGVADEPAFSAMAHAYARMGFAHYKLKLSGDREGDARNCRVLWSLQPAPASVRVDANNLWSNAEDAVASLRRLPGALAGVEEPVGAGRLDDLARVADALGVPVILDESATRAEHVEALPGPVGRWIVNVRVSKMGGILRSLDVVQAAQARGIALIVGAQVGETSLLTRAAMTIATAAGHLLVGHEGAFGTQLLTEDVCIPPVMFGRGGELRWADHPGSTMTGFGIVP